MSLKIVACLMLATIGMAAFAVEAPPPLPVAPSTTPLPQTQAKPATTTPAITIVPAAISAQPIQIKNLPRTAAEWSQCLADFQSTDAAKQQAAAKILVDSGSNGFNQLQNLLKSPNPDVVKRATETRQQIEMQAYQLYQEALALAGKVQKEPLTVAALEQLRQTWMRAAIYAPRNEMKQSCFQNSQEIQNTRKSVEEAMQQLASLDARLKSTPGIQGLSLAALQLERAAAFKTLQRHADALAAAEECVKASGKTGRHTPAALKAQTEACISLDDRKKTEALCRQILEDYPRSLEIRFAYSSLVQALIADKRWDEATQTAMAFVTNCPLDDGAQESLYGVLDSLMNTERDYARVVPLAEWIYKTLPPDRLTAEVPKVIGGCSEYVLKDYAKAAQAYTILRDQFADMVSASDMDGALARVKQKAEGKFPIEPSATDVGQAGIFAQFLKAVRKRDSKAIKTLVPKDDADDMIESLGGGGFDSDIVPTVTFADFILKKVELDEKKESATITLDYYDASSSKPKTMTQQAVLEDGQWKITWESPAGENENMQLAPAPAEVK